MNRVMRCKSESMEFRLLKQKLLLEKLNEVEDFTCHALIMDEACTAAQLALETDVPGLVFPCLFLERAAAVESALSERLKQYWGELDGTAAPTPAPPASSGFANAVRILSRRLSSGAAPTGDREPLGSLAALETHRQAA